MERLGPQPIWRNVQDLTPGQRSRLEGRVQRAQQAFEQHFGPLERPIQLDLDPQDGALRTGYHPDSDWVRFPASQGVAERGIECDDVVHHEVFHAMVAQKFPHTLPLDHPDKEVLHEALADWFAYQLNPDQEFGENYRQSGEALRNYRNDFRLPLVSGSHATGNALTDLLLEHQVSWKEVARFLQQPQFDLGGLAAAAPSVGRDLSQELTMRLEDRVTNYPPSSRRRYRIAPDRPLAIEFHPSPALLQAHPRLQVEWPGSEHFTITPQGEGRFTIAPRPQGEASKLVALFKEDGKVLGFRPFYFSSERAAAAKPSISEATGSTEPTPSTL